MVTVLVLDIVNIIGAKEAKDLEITVTLTWFGPLPGKDMPVRGYDIPSLCLLNQSINRSAYSFHVPWQFNLITPDGKATKLNYNNKMKCHGLKVNQIPSLLLCFFFYLMQYKFQRS